MAINRAAAGQPHPDEEDSPHGTGQAHRNTPPGHFKAVAHSKGEGDVTSTPGSTPVSSTGIQRHTYSVPALNALVEADNEDAAEYLSTRGWFNRNTDRQDRVLLICDAGFGSAIFGAAGDFNDELTRVEKLVTEQQNLVQMPSPISVSASNVGSNTATSNTVLRGIVAVNLPSLSEAVQLSKFTKNTMSTLPGHLLVVFTVLLLAGLVYCAVRQRRSSVTSGLPLTVDQISDTSNDVQTADKNERVIVTFEPSRTVYTMPEDLPPYKMPLGKPTTGTTLCSH